MTAVRPPFSSSISALARSVMLPRPVVYAALIPSRPRMIPPVGKSGPLMIFISASSLVSASSIIVTRPSTSSPRLWGGMLLAMPTAMPEAPFISRCGTLAGSTTGSFSYSS